MDVDETSRHSGISDQSIEIIGSRGFKEEKFQTVSWTPEKNVVTAESGAQFVFVTKEVFVDELFRHCILGKNVVKGLIMAFCDDFSVKHWQSREIVLLPLSFASMTNKTSESFFLHH